MEVVADVARTRETPVASTSIAPKKIEEQLASQDIPLLLNKTPGVYATQQGGGDGDSRINIRGFNQRNVAVMVDGIPVNDMENGWVYWSNWFGRCRDPEHPGTTRPWGLEAGHTFCRW